MSESPIEPRVLQALASSTDAAFVAELLSTFFEDSPRQISALRTALAEGDADAFRRAAHSLKSNSASLGAMGLSARAKELEMMAKAGSLDGAAAAVDDLAGEYARVENALREWRHES
jgi:HPt (histidine-containing phosphotransfer) domain-containing protein